MQTYYNTWLQKEKNWIEEIEQKRKKEAYMHAIIAIVCCVVALAGIGFMAGGIGPAVSNIKYGLILGVFGGGLYLVIMLNAHMAKKYVKYLEKEVGSECRSEEEKEQFACAMLGGAEGKESVACMEFVRQKGAVPEQLCVSGNFAFLRGMMPCLVTLDKLEQMEVDVEQRVSKVRSGDYVIRLNYSTYPIFFYYHKSQSGTSGSRKDKMDKVMVFPSKELRDEAAKMMSGAQSQA